MAISGFLMNADEDQVITFNAAVMKKAGLHIGLPLKPTSSTRAYISIDSFKQVKSALGENELHKLLQKTKISILDEVEEADAKSLIETRDPEDIADRPDLEQPARLDPVSNKMLDWHLVEAGIATAWGVLGGPDTIPWGDVVIGHIDTGFTTNPALGFKPDLSDWVDTVRDRNFFEKELDPPEGMPPTSATPDSAADDLNGFSGRGHGTRTMSVLCGFSEAASAKSAGTYAGYYGAAPKVPVIPIRLENTIWIQNTLQASLPDAIDYLVDQGVGVISLSMGSPRLFALGITTTPTALRGAIDNAYDKGVIFCCAAGNNVPDERVVFPARCARTIAVAGSAPNLNPWLGSSYGVQVDISAPAFPIRRANTRRPGNKFEYGVGDGTSFATPLVAGTAAMWLARHQGTLEQSYPEGWQRVAAFLDILRRTATPGNNWNTSVRGPGILNAGAVLNAPLPDKATLKRDTTFHE